MRRLKRWTLLIPLAVLLAAAGCHHTHPTSDVTDLEARLTKIETQLTALTDWAHGNDKDNPSTSSVNYWLEYYQGMVESYRDACEKVLEPKHGYMCLLPTEPPSGSDPPTGKPPEFP